MNIGDPVEYQGTEYYPTPTLKPVILSTPLANSSSGNFNRTGGGGGRGGGGRTTSLGYRLPDHIQPPPELSVPYLSNIRVSTEVVVHQPPQSYASRQPGARPAPKITLQTELGTLNFHEVNKDELEDLDPELTLTLPSWELRQPDDDEIEESRSFEDDEAKWDDEYWKNVGAYRELLLQNPREAPWQKSRASTSSTNSRKGTVANGPQEDPLSFQRGDSFRINPKVPPAATGPVTNKGGKVKKPPLPAAATRGTKKSGASSDVGSESGVSVRSSGTPHLHLDAKSSSKNRSSSTGASSVADSNDEHNLSHNEPSTAPATPLFFERGESVLAGTASSMASIVPSLVLNDESILRQDPDVNAPMMTSDDGGVVEYQNTTVRRGDNNVSSNFDFKETSGRRGSDPVKGATSPARQPVASTRGRGGDSAASKQHPVHRRGKTEEELALLSMSHASCRSATPVQGATPVIPPGAVEGVHFRVSESLLSVVEWSLVPPKFTSVILKPSPLMVDMSTKEETAEETAEEGGQRERKTKEGGCCTVM